jgi:hypothetical protein
MPLKLLSHRKYIIYIFDFFIKKFFEVPFYVTYDVHVIRLGVVYIKVKIYWLSVLC